MITREDREQFHKAHPAGAIEVQDEGEGDDDGAWEDVETHGMSLYMPLCADMIQVAEDDHDAPPGLQVDPADIADRRLANKEQQALMTSNFLDEEDAEDEESEEDDGDEESDDDGDQEDDDHDEHDEDIAKLMMTANTNIEEGKSTSRLVGPQMGLGPQQVAISMSNPTSPSPVQSPNIKQGRQSPNIKPIIKEKKIKLEVEDPWSDSDPWQRKGSVGKAAMGPWTRLPSSIT